MSAFFKTNPTTRFLFFFWINKALQSEIWSSKGENIARRPVLDTSFTHLESCYWTCDIEKADIIQAATAENVDSDLMAYSRRPRLPIQEQDPISLTRNQSSTLELSTSNPSNLSLLNHGFDIHLDILIAIWKVLEVVLNILCQIFYPIIDFATCKRHLPLICPRFQFLKMYIRL